MRTGVRILGASPGATGLGTVGNRESDNRTPVPIGARAHRVSAQRSP